MRNTKAGVILGTLSLAAAFIALLVRFPGATLPTVHAQVQAQDDEGCGLQTLTGGYGLTFHGLGTSGPVPAPIGAFIPVAGVGRVTFDGNGNLSLSETVSFGGRVALLSLPGTYTVKSDCTGSLQVEGAASLNFVIVHHGNELLAINTDTGRVATDNLEKQ